MSRKEIKIINNNTYFFIMFLYLLSFVELPCLNNRVIVTTRIPSRRTALRSFFDRTPGSTIYGETGKKKDVYGSRMGSAAVPFPVVGDSSVRYGPPPAS